MNKKLISILIADLLAAAPAFAQSDDFKLQGALSVGGIYVDDKDALDASKMNEYRDLSNGVLTTFDVKGRGTRYWLDAFGENLGRDDQYLNLRGGMYDVFKYRLYSDAMKHNFLFNGITPYAGAGSAAQTATFPQLNTATWNSLDIAYKRRDDGLHFEFQGASPWYVRAEANQITWSGTKPGASSQGLSPGNGFVDLAFPVEYKTRNATLEGGYNTKTMHFDLAWMTSKFENSNETMTWTNGFWGNGTDRTYLAPDNKYTRIAGNATFRQLPWSSTFAARYTADELKSDAVLGTSVLNTAAGASALTGPNTATFNGKVTNQTFTLSLASAPVKALDTRLYYNYRKRDDESTHVEFDSTAIPGPFDSEPFSYEKDNYGFDAYYRINRANRLGVGYDYLDTKREGRFDYDRTKDRRWFAEWKNSSLDELAVRLKYTRLDRKSNFLLANDGTGTGDVNYLNRFVTAFDLSNVDQDQWKLTLDYSPMQFLDISFEGIVKNNKYKDNVLGRLKDDRTEYYVSVSYGQPSGPRLTVFADAEEIKYDSQHRVAANGSTVTGTYDPFSPPTAASYNWTGNIKDRNWAAGIAFDWPVMKQLTIKASAIYYKTDGFVDLALQDGVPASVVRPVPIDGWDDSKRTSLTVKAVYALNKTWTLTGGYAFEKYEYRDSQFEGYRNTIPAATQQNSYLDGVYANPQYKANIIYGLVTYRF
jgi:MtrB/PioB family decaheme-associated outer membrane protein